MHTVPALPELQRQFLSALYDDDEPGPIASVYGNGLEPEARLRIYRRSCNEIQTGALRTTYPAVLALVGEAFFGQTARGYRLAHPSCSGNLQAFGAHFADYLASLPAARGLPYLPDVARLEWLRQQAALAADAEPLSADDATRTTTEARSSAQVSLHPCVRLLASPDAVLAVWRYAMHPTHERLKLPETGERVMLWREGDQVAMTALDAASFACIEALAHGNSLDGAYSAGCAQVADFDFAACIKSIVDRDLLVTITSLGPHEDPITCRSSIA